MEFHVHEEQVTHTKKMQMDRSEGMEYNNKWNKKTVSGQTDRQSTNWYGTADWSLFKRKHIMRRYICVWSGAVRRVGIMDLRCDLQSNLNANAAIERGA